MNAIHRAIIAMAVVAALSTSSATAISIDTVFVGDAGNPADMLSPPRGAVGYDYRMGTTEVTNAQYAAFLNAKAGTDPLGLWDANMGSDSAGGITRIGLDGNYSYLTRINMADKPVTYVDWYSAIRFTNWLNNGQGTGDTETGTYTLLGGTPTPSNFATITRSPDATWFVPNQDEWHKAGFYQPADKGGDSDGYWLYATASNTDPTVATADASGNISNPGPNVANYANGADWHMQDGLLTTVASAGPLSRSYYGTYDQSGNVWEWNEGIFTEPPFRILAGGYWGNNALNISAYSFSSVYPSDDYRNLGFRVATVPEPSTWALAWLACTIAAGAALGRKPRRSRRP